MKTKIEKMINIEVPTRDVVDIKAQNIFDALNSKLGMIPNIYAVTGYSSDALESHLDTTNKVGKGSFSNKELEAIRLAVSEVNSCDYCVAAHTAIAKMNGFSDKDAKSFRDLNASDTKLLAITTLAANIVSTKGSPSDKNLEEFFNQGYDKKALVDLVAVIVDITFTNYIFGITNVPIDFPRVETTW